MDEEAPNKTDRAQYVTNLTLAAVAGQVGCLTLIVIFVALLGGMWLDGMFDTKPLFLIILLLGSVPVTLALMFWVVRKATSKIKPASKTLTEDADSGE